MIVLLATVYCLTAHAAYAQLANVDQSKKSCGDLGHYRSIWDIVWSCLATIFSCTWLAVHLSVPKQGRGRRWRFGRCIAAFGIALIAPELIIQMAWDQRAFAKKIAAEHKGDFWLIARSWMDSYTWFLCHHGRLMVHDVNGGKDYVLHPDDIGTYLHNGQINVTEEQIQDRSKGDMLTKGLAVLQTTWFILQLFARAVERLPITELEISTLAFAILNGMTYALWWDKPLDAQCPIVLTQSIRVVNLKADGSVASNSIGGGSTDGGMQARLVNRDLEKHQQGHRRRQRSSVPFLEFGVHGGASTTSIYILAAVGVLFGGIHCIAWASHFPTTPEKLLWRITSIATVIIPTLCGVYIFLQVRGSVSAIVDNIVILPMLNLYPIARLFLLVLAFTTLRSLPSDAYTTVHWTTLVPHI